MLAADRVTDNIGQPFSASFPTEKTSRAKHGRHGELHVGADIQAGVLRQPHPVGAGGDVPDPVHHSGAGQR